MTLSAVAYVFETWRDTKCDWRQRLRVEIAEANAGLRAFRFAIPAVVYLVDNHIRFLVLKALASPVRLRAGEGRGFGGVRAFEGGELSRDDGCKTTRSLLARYFGFMRCSSSFYFVLQNKIEKEVNDA